MPTLILVADPSRTPLDPALVRRLQASMQGDQTTLSPGEAVRVDGSREPDLELVGDAPVDVFVLPAAARRCRLLIADMDSTIVTGETLDELAAFAGVGEQVAAITRRSMNGEIDFSAALRDRVALLRGLELSALERTWAGVRLTPGAAELVATMRAHGAMTALVSGGFTFFTGRVAALCGFDLHRANTLVDDGCVLTGAVSEPILDRGAKLAVLRELSAGMPDSMAVGDGANDLDMIRAAGVGVAFHAKPVVAAEARFRVEHSGLRALLFLQGYAVSEFSSPSAV